MSWLFLILLTWNSGRKLFLQSLQKLVCLLKAEADISHTRIYFDTASHVANLFSESH